MKTYICHDCGTERKVSNNFTQDKIDCSNCGKFAVSLHQYNLKIAETLRGNQAKADNILPENMDRKKKRPW